MTRQTLRILLALAALATLAAGCPNPGGSDSCESDTDCFSDQVCNTSTNQCVPEGSLGDDAESLDSGEDDTGPSDAGDGDARDTNDDTTDTGRDTDTAGDVEETGTDGEQMDGGRDTNDVVGDGTTGDADDAHDTDDAVDGGDARDTGDALDGQGTDTTDGGDARDTADTGAPRFVDLSVSQYFACAVHSNGEIQCWGDTSRKGAKEVSNANSSYDFKSVTTGFRHACGRTLGTQTMEDRTICWGNSTYGQNQVPTQYRATAFAHIDAGKNFNCGITTSGKIVCWGQDDSGQVSNSPGGTDWVQLSAADTHACALDSSDKIECWGDDTNKKVSEPNNAPQSAIHVSAGDEFTCIVDKSLSEIICWGEDDEDQISNIPNGTFSIVRAGIEFGCGVGTGKNLSCWGNNLSDQANPPQGSFADVAPSDSHACGLLDTGKIECWGSDSNGITSPPSP